MASPLCPILSNPKKRKIENVISDEIGVSYLFFKIYSFKE